ncbi:catalase family protein [Variovorax sp. KK3]|uniref:catalase family protein n=1 Tax=Variovorax sp. KK3 TaxID=1855728 RepID=UPI00097C3293|nr:catalase family protein [Variovorax sp. KK3]
MNTMPPAAVAPLAYTPDVEQPEDDEAETGRELIDTMLKISTKVYEDEGHAYRSVHAKGHGILRAELEVLGGLPDSLAQGVFAKPARYPVVMRFSTPPGDLLDDKVSTPRAVAIKIVGVDGPRVEGSEGHATQDFLMVNGPAFNTPNAKKFLGKLKMLAATTDKAPGLKQVLSAALRGAESLVEKVGGESASLKAMGGHPLTHILGETFFTQVPLRHGPYMAKLSLAPVSPELMQLTDQELDTKDKPDAIRDAVVDHFRRSEGIWELRVQLCVDLERMPIEDASVEWPQELSPYVTVARLVAKPQAAWSDARVAAVNDGMSFSPWHALAAHRPLGSVMRVRKAAYEAAARFRAGRNAKQVEEPTSLDHLPD